MLVFKFICILITLNNDDSGRIISWKLRGFSTKKLKDIIHIYFMLHFRITVSIFTEDKL